MSLKKIKKKVKYYKDGKIYEVVEEWESGQLNNFFPKGERFIKVISKEEIQIDSVDSLRAEINLLKQEIKSLKK